MPAVVATIDGEGEAAKEAAKAIRRVRFSGPVTYSFLLHTRRRDVTRALARALTPRLPLPEGREQERALYNLFLRDS